MRMVSRPRKPRRVGGSFLKRHRTGIRRAALIGGLLGAGIVARRPLAGAARGLRGAAGFVATTLPGDYRAIKDGWSEYVPMARESAKLTGGWQTGAIVHRGPFKQFRSAARWTRYKAAVAVGQRAIERSKHVKGPSLLRLARASRGIDAKLMRRLRLARGGGAGAAADAGLMQRAHVRMYQTAFGLPRRLGRRRALMLTPGRGEGMGPTTFAHELGHLTRGGRNRWAIGRRVDQRKLGSKAAVLAEEARANFQGMRIYRRAGGRRRDFLRAQALPYLSYLLSPRGMMS